MTTAVRAESVKSVPIMPKLATYPKQNGLTAYFGEFAQAFRLKAPTVSAKPPT